MLTYLIYISLIESVDHCRECNAINEWPRCFVVAMGEIETQAKSEFLSPQLIAKVITWIGCKLKKITNTVTVVYWMKCMIKFNVKLVFMNSRNVYIYNIVAIESRDYTPPLVHASIGQKWGGGSYAGSWHFRVMIVECHVSVLSLYLLWLSGGQTREKQQNKAWN